MFEREIIALGNKNLVSAFVKYYKTRGTIFSTWTKSANNFIQLRK